MIHTKSYISKDSIVPVKAKNTAYTMNWQSCMNIVILVKLIISAVFSFILVRHAQSLIMNHFYKRQL